MFDAIVGVLHGLVWSKQHWDGRPSQRVTLTTPLYEPFATVTVLHAMPNTHTVLCEALTYLFDHPRDHHQIITDACVAFHADPVRSPSYGQRYFQMGNRPLLMGDILIIDSTIAYRCEPSGWVKTWEVPQYFETEPGAPQSKSAALMDHYLHRV